MQSRGMALRTLDVSAIFFIDKNVGFFGGYGLVLGGGCFVFTIFLNKLSSDVCF